MVLAASRPAIHQQSSDRPNPARVLGISGALVVHTVLVGFLLMPILNPAPPFTARSDTTTIRWPDPIPKAEPLPPIPAAPSIPKKATPVRTTAPVTPIVIDTPSTVHIDSPPVPTARPEQGEVIEGPEQVDLGPATMGAGELALVYAPLAYPGTALPKRAQGTVLVRILIGTDGRPVQVKLERSSGEKILDRSALAQIQKWVFKAAMRNGQAVQAWAIVPIEFKLAEG